MKKLFVPYNIAAALKAKGFDDHCSAWVFADGSSPIPHYEWRLTQNEYAVLLPSHEQAFDWLEENHKIRIDILKRFTGKNTFYIHTWDGERGIWVTDGNTLSWIDKYEAMNIAIEEALKLI